jgi:DNA (cytosine-5)-methyltransferase 1
LSRAYYNENDPFKAEVLRVAIRAGAIAYGDVDQRSIKHVSANDLHGYTQCHFFAGGGFWSLALRRAGWPDHRPAWTGSCPCPSFSLCGKGQGLDDPSHLWPHWFRLVRERKPATLFGEQSADAIRYGWLDLVQSDLEARAYAVGKAVLGACSVGAPHIRQRLYFVGYTLGEGLEGHGRDGYDRNESGRVAQEKDRSATEAGSFDLVYERARSAPLGSYWRDADWLRCRDGKYRAVEPGTQPLASGYPARVDLLRMAGDAINVEVATAFIRAYMRTPQGQAPDADAPPHLHLNAYQAKDKIKRLTRNKDGTPRSRTEGSTHSSLSAVR